MMMLVPALLFSTVYAAAPVALPCGACTLADAIAAASPPVSQAGFWLSIDKSDHQMTAWVGSQAVKTWRVGLGEPAGDKVREGDMKTPNGRFFVVTRNPKSQFHLFLGLGYPDASDAERGLEAGLINSSQATAIRQASAARRVPPWNTTLGGAIGIHGGGGSSDWTLGCIAITNAEIEDLWKVAKMGTVVEISE